jgi:hypothetical protein
MMLAGANAAIGALSIPDGILHKIDPTGGAQFTLMMTTFSATKWGPSLGALGRRIGCFEQGTLVATEDGLVEIETVTPGTRVWSYNEETGEIELREVVAVSSREATAVVYLYIEDEVIRTTEEHPFWADGVGWKDAAELNPGDKLWRLDGDTVEVQNVVIENKPTFVYNLEVEGSGTYFVAEREVLVHNSFLSGLSRSATNGGRAVHLTTNAGGAAINRTGQLVGNIYAGPLSNALSGGLRLTLRTGLSNFQAAVRIPQSSMGAFSRPLPIGPMTLWQRITGQMYTARGALNLGSGEFSRLGVNWNQFGMYAVDAAVTGGLIGAGAYGLSE